MVFQVKSTQSTPTVSRTKHDNWMKGTVTAFDAGRSPIDGLRSGSNIVLDQNGTVRPRPSLIKYGPTPLGTILGEVFEFSVQTGLSKVYWMISLQNVAGVTSAYIAKGEDITWTLCSGKTFDNTARAHFLQVQQKVLIMNGVDTLSYMNIATSLVVSYTALTATTVPSGVPTGLTGSAYNVYYAVTASSSVGETNGSPVLTQPVLIDRDSWNPATMNVKVSWGAVTGAKAYNLYMGISQDGAGQPITYLIAGGLDPAVLSFTDDGSAAQDLTRILPTTNSTAGPKASRGEVINSRVWMVGDKDNPYYVWHGGDFGFELDFSPSNGGGYSPVGPGSKEIPVSVKGGNSGKGDATVRVLSQGSNGAGKRYLMSPTSVTYGSSTFVVWQVVEDNNQDGTDAPDGVISYKNNIYYPSRDGFKTTGTKPQLQNVLSTDRISNTIQPDISRLNTVSMPLCVGLAYEGRLYWSLPVSNTSNNEIWTLDLDRQGAWMKPWSIAADWMWLYNDNSGITHFCILKGNVIYETSYSQLTADSGIGFITDLSSGILKFSDDGMEWAKLIKVIFTVLHPQGNINVNITAMTDEGLMNFVGGSNFGADYSVVGWGEASDIGILGWGRHRWSGIGKVPVTSSTSSTDIEVEVDEEAQWWTFGLSTSGAGVNYQLSAVTPIFVKVGVKSLS